MRLIDLLYIIITSFAGIYTRKTHPIKIISVSTKMGYRNRKIEKNGYPILLY